MHTKIYLRIILKVAALLLLLGTLLFAYGANRDLKKIYGGFTPQVDSAHYVQPKRSFAIVNAQVLSSDGTRFISDQTVVVENGLISAVGGAVDLDNTIQIIDAQGHYLIPGLTDSHVHLWQSANDLLLYVANGITQIRELAGTAEHLEWRADVESGTRLGPDMYIASTRIGSFGFWEGLFMAWTQGFLNLNDPSQAEDVVMRLQGQGYDALKVYAHLDRENFNALTKAADKHGMTLLGHVPWRVSIEDLYPSFKSIAHLEEIMNAMNREFGGYSSSSADEFLAYVDGRVDTIALRLKDEDIAVSTTLWLVESFIPQMFYLEEALKTVELKYVNPGLSEWTPRVPQGGLGWLPGVNRYNFAEGDTPEQTVRRLKYWETYAKACQKVLMSLYRNEVSIMAGTDANITLAVPGFSLHDELLSMAEKGMSNAEVLKSATSVPARWLNNNAGVIDAGFKANLVLLAGNPLNDLANTKNIRAVFLNGQYLDRHNLDQILLDVQRANNKSRTINIDKYID